MKPQVKAKVFGLGLVLALGLQGSARAELETVLISGTVNHVDYLLAGRFSVGEPFEITYTFDTTTSPRNGSTSSNAGFDALTEYNFTIGIYTGASTAARGIQIDNGPEMGFFDRFAVVARAADGLTGSAVADFSLEAVGFQLDDPTNQVFVDALVLPTSLDLSDFGSRTLFAVFRKADMLVTVEGAIATATIGSNGTLTASAITRAGDAAPGVVVAAAVPEPSSIVMAGLIGLVGAGFLWRRSPSLGCR